MRPRKPDVVIVPVHLGVSSCPPARPPAAVAAVAAARLFRPRAGYARLLFANDWSLMIVIINTPPIRARIPDCERVSRRSEHHGRRAHRWLSDLIDSSHRGVEVVVDCVHAGVLGADSADSKVTRLLSRRSSVATSCVSRETLRCPVKASQNLDDALASLSMFVCTQPIHDLCIGQVHDGGALSPMSLSTPTNEPAAESAVPPEAPPAPAGRPLPRVIAIANQKGGVGKTTTTVNLGACLAELGFKTLVIDLDPQGNASTGLGIENRGLETSMYHVIMHEVPLEDCIEPSAVRNLFVAPASLDLAGAEIELVPAFSRENRLRRAIEAVLDVYDYVLIDCPPSLGLLTVNGLNAAHEVLVPIQCEYYALEGLGQLLRNVDLVKRNLNPTLDVSTIVCVMYDARTKLSDQVVKEVREHFGDKVCRTVVPRTVRLSEAPSFGQPIITFDPTSRGAVAYREVAKEVSRGSTGRAG